MIQNNSSAEQIQTEPEQRVYSQAYIPASNDPSNTPSNDPSNEPSNEPSNGQSNAGRQVTNDVVLKVRNLSTSIPNFAALLMVEYFNMEELVDPNVNVNGRLAKGVKKQPIPKSLDIKRIEIIRRTVLGYADGSQAEKFLIWKKCLTAMIKKQLDLKKKAKNF